MLNIALKVGVSPGPRAIVYSHRRVRFNAPIELLRGTQLDLAEGNLHAWMNPAGNVYFGRLRQRLATLRFEERFISDHMFDWVASTSSWKTGGQGPYASITWIRFCGSAPNPFEALSAFVPPNDGNRLAPLC